MNALIVVDMQRALADLDVCAESFKRATPVVRAAIARNRERNEPVIFTRGGEARRLGGDEGWQIVSELGARESDLIVDKDFPNAFWQTSLDVRLRALGVSQVTVCGCFAMACVYLTHHGALERGYSSSILKGGIVSSDPALIELLARMTGA